MKTFVILSGLAALAVALPYKNGRFNPGGLESGVASSGFLPSCTGSGAPYPTGSGFASPSLFAHHHHSGTGAGGAVPTGLPSGTGGLKKREASPASFEAPIASGSALSGPSGAAGSGAAAPSGAPAGEASGAAAPSGLGGAAGGHHHSGVGHAKPSGGESGAPSESGGAGAASGTAAFGKVFKHYGTGSFSGSFPTGTGAFPGKPSGGFGGSGFPAAPTATSGGF